MSIGPGILVPTIDGMRMIYPLRLGIVVGAITISEFSLGTGLSWFTCLLPPSITRYRRRFQPPDPVSGSAAITVDDLQALCEYEQRIWQQYLRWAGKVGVAPPIREELVFRGGPYLLALTLGGLHEQLLLTGTIIWVIAHRRGIAGSHSHVLPIFMSGVLYAYLWSFGLWWVAIIVHIVNNLMTVGVLMIQEWWTRRQAPFAVGDQVEIAVDERPHPTSGGLIQATTPDGKILHVTGVTPGETCTARIAASWKGHTEAFPIAQTEESVSGHR
jgi:membrane protease YdiL (CAAX protease family)